MKTIARLFLSLTLVVLFLGLLALPIAGRWLWFNRGVYKAPEIAQIESDQITLPSVAYTSYNDKPEAMTGQVVIDLAHQNNLQVDDLAPLKERLAARGVTVQIYDGQDLLDTRLRSASAWIVLAPTVEYSVEEQQSLLAFVKDGGRLLLAADPTRQVPDYGGGGDLFSIFFPTSAVPAVNSLTNIFGVSYFEDYLYSLENYAGNFRNVKFNQFAKDTPLTQGLSTIVLFAAHSLKGDGTMLITGDEQTLSNVRSGETGLSPAMMVFDGQVLVLGDLTFMTAPYNRVADNDHLLSNLADWLAVDTRVRDLKDFPYLYQLPSQTIDLVQSVEEAIDPQLINDRTPLVDFFATAGMTLTLREKVEAHHDSLLLATFDKLDLVQSYLENAGVTITYTVKVGEQDSTNSSSTSTGKGNAETSESAEKDKLKDTIQIKGLGTFTTNASLFVVDKTADRTIVAVLAQDSSLLKTAIQRLIEGDFKGCLQNLGVMICATGESASSDTGVVPTPVVTPSSAGILIISVDSGTPGTSSGVSEMESILGGLYDVKVWSTYQDGFPTESDLTGYDAYIVATGDYAYDPQKDDSFLPLMSIQGNLLIIGDQPLPPYLFTVQPSPLSELAVVDATHPLAAGFTDGQILALSESMSGVPSLVLSQADMTGGQSSIVLTRGPNAFEAGSPALTASDTGDQRIVLAIFAFNRLPSDAQTLFAMNVASWLLGK